MQAARWRELHGRYHDSAAQPRRTPALDPGAGQGAADDARTGHRPDGAGARQSGVRCDVRSGGGRCARAPSSGRTRCNCGSASSIPPTPAPFEETPEQARTSASRRRNGARSRCSTSCARAISAIADHMLKGVDALEGWIPGRSDQIRFATKGFIDAVSPTNLFPPPIRRCVEKIVETRASLLKVCRTCWRISARGR